MARSHSPPALSSPSDRTRPKHRVVKQYRGARRTIRSQARTHADQSHTVHSPWLGEEAGSIVQAASSPARPTPSPSSAPGHSPRILTEDEDDVFSSQSLFRDRDQPLHQTASLTIPAISSTRQSHGALKEITTSHAFNSASQPHASVRHSRQQQQQGQPTRPLIPDRYTLPSPPRTYYKKPTDPSPLLVARRSLASSSRHHLENTPVVRSSQNAIDLSLTPLRPSLRTKPLGVGHQAEEDSIFGPVSFSARRASGGRRTSSTSYRHGSPRLGRQILRTPVQQYIRPDAAEVEVEAKVVPDQDSIFSPSRIEGDLTLHASFFAAAPLGESTPFARGSHLMDSILDTDAAESDMHISVQAIAPRPAEDDAGGAPADETIKIQRDPDDTVPGSAQGSAEGNQVKANDTRPINIAIHADSIISSFEASALNVLPSPTNHALPSAAGPSSVREEAQGSPSPSKCDSSQTHISLPAEQPSALISAGLTHVSEGQDTRGEQGDCEMSSVLLSADGCRASIPSLGF